MLQHVQPMIFFLTFMPLTRAILEGENPWTMAKIANTMNAVAFIVKGELDFCRIQEKNKK